jgi:hypothetical protein
VSAYFIRTVFLGLTVVGSSLWVDLGWVVGTAFRGRTKESAGISLCFSCVVAQTVDWLLSAAAGCWVFCGQPANCRDKGRFPRGTV